MITVAQKIMQRIRQYGDDTWVCTPSDFLDLGSRTIIDKALSRLVKDGSLRRISRGLYDLPRMRGILNRPAAPNVDAAIKALARRDNIKFMPDGIVAANSLGLTNAVPAKTAYLTDGTTRTLKVGGRTVHLKHARKELMSWLDRPGLTVVLALDWLGKLAASGTEVINNLRSRLPDDVKQDLLKGKDILPSWMAKIVDSINQGQNVSVAA
ncbi:MAG TPA: DUF6088 family protein [Kamptonema sp.]|nr:DUF6088 family protein [Kamptonema sp.]